MRNAREGIGEALIGDRTGQPLSRESTLFPGADVVPLTEGNKPMMYDREKSDPAIVAVKLTNKAG
jgi:hypothetical protein